MTDWIGDTFTSEVGWSHLETLVDIGNRMAGSPGEREAMEVTRDALESVGARDARIDPFEIQGWERGDSTIMAHNTTQDCIALPRSPAGAASGELVDLGYGLPEDFDRDLSGKVVVVSSTVPDHYDRFIHRREKYYYAVESGAEGFIFANHVPGQLPPTGSVGTAEAPIGDIPAVGVSKEVGARLGRRFEGEEVTLEVTCETPETDSGNVHAELGPETDDEVLVTSHLDAHDIAEGAMDNGAGTAMVVELARALAAREDELETRVRFVCFGAEEVGLVGSEHEAERLGAHRANVKAIVNNDGVVAGRTLRLHTHGFDELDDAAKTVADRFDHDISTIPEQLPHSDHWPFVAYGVPAYMVGSEKEGRGRGWGHTHADTIEKLESRTLREQAILLTELTVELARADREIPHADPADIAAALESEDQAEGMKVTGDWPF
ncbi:M28 family peptidase [Haloferax sp. MBLA0076]|uniref:Carboxypeptidase Q n=1 Tax=Haloferax litoreum TaxID=2666140 RepID=A0A6A8GDE6_9EURY|nr:MULTISPECIES: M28 family peptidase [Haloferax]KAB1192114.1 M28 family peptidase [Haloferax sp. CBA1148]MRX20562.1 M28 family peptidase [Haloferax litoreum]